MLSEKDLGELVDAIANTNAKVEAVSIELLLHKATHYRSNHVAKELTDWGEWARRIIVALITTLAAIVGYKFAFGGA